MAFNTALAERVRNELSKRKTLRIREKKMFGGLAFLVNGKMCVNVSGENLMCRFDPALTAQLAARPGFLPMVMKGRTLNGYCYVAPEGYRENTDFEFWLNLCLAFNTTAKASKKAE